MTKPKRKTPTPRKGEKAPRDLPRVWEIFSIEEMEKYTSNHQVDPWRGQFMQLSWDYCI